MNTDDLRNSLKARLAGMAGRPATAWPNVTLDPGTLPRLEVSFEAIDQHDESSAGGQIDQETGSMAVIVCVERGQGDTAALDYAKAIKDLFPKAQRFTFTGGKVVITAPTQIRAGFPDQTEYRVPVMVRYLATATT